MWSQEHRQVSGKLQEFRSSRMRRWLSGLWMVINRPPCVSESSSFCLRGVPGGSARGKGWSLRLQRICERCRLARANKLRDCFQSVTLADKVAAPEPLIPAVLSLKQTLCYVRSLYKTVPLG